MTYNVIGAVLWVGSLLPAGWCFGNFAIVMPSIPPRRVEIQTGFPKKIVRRLKLSRTTDSIPQRMAGCS